MAWPTSLQVALKEWDVVCRALTSGRQMVLLRKGGISEAGDGSFQVQHDEFLLFPTFLHQNKQMLKPGRSGGVHAAERGAERGGHRVGGRRDGHRPTEIARSR
jgi:hypothetical protein